MNIKIGDLVTRVSYGNDIVFVVLDFDGKQYILKGCDVRLVANSPLEDLVLVNDYKEDSFSKEIVIDSNYERNEYFYLPAKILHIDADNDYLSKCLNFYKSNRIVAYGHSLKEEEMPSKVFNLLNKYKPDILVVTGHDAFYKKNEDKDNLANYKNSLNFVNSVKEARRFEKSHEKLIVIAGACQSNYEELIKAGADFASSPKRVNIHALDPAIIAASLALSEKNKEVDVVKLLEKTKFGKDGMGGLIVNGLMYVGYPR